MTINPRLMKSLYWLIWLISLAILAHFGVLDLANYFFLLAAVISWGYILSYNGRRIIQHYLSVRYRVSFWAISGLFCFMLYGRTLFMQDTRFYLSFPLFIDFIILVIALYPLTLGLLALMEKVANSIQVRESTKKECKKIGICCFLIVFSTDFLFSLGFYPCVMTNDSVKHWMQATEQIELTDYSPIAYNLILKALFSATNFTSPYIYTIFQVCIFALVIGNIAAFLKHRGVSAFALLIGAFLVAVCPTVYMQLLYLSKNPLTAILCLWVSVSLAEILTDPEECLSSIIWVIKTSLAIVGLYLVRENNVVIAFPLILFVVWFMIRYRRNEKRILLLCGCIICLIVLMQGVAYKTVDYEHVEKKHETIRPLLAPVGSALQQGLALPEEIIAAAERVLPLEEWRSRYDPFGSDAITWGDPKPKYSELTYKEAFTVYFKMLKLYPDVVIRDRLDGANLIWDIRADVYRCPTGLVDTAQFEEIRFLKEGITGLIVKAIRETTFSLFLISIRNNIIDILLWKNGIYVYFLLVSIAFLVRNKILNFLWIVFPGIMILLTYLLVIAWQMFFYIWFFQLTIVLLIIVGVVESSRLRNNMP